MLALGLSPQGWIRGLLDPIVRLPTGRFARLAADFEQRLADSGIETAMGWLLNQFVDSVEVRGGEHVPSEGPLLVAANHPGAYDGIAMAANLGRDDLKIAVSDVPFTRALPATAQHLIYVGPDTYSRMIAVRAMIRHLQAGGALLVFPSGFVDPDPDLEPGSAQTLETWSSSLELILRKVPATQLIVAIVSGVLAKSCLRNPLTRLTQTAWEKRKLAEFLQVSQQLALSRKFSLHLRVSFGEPITPSNLSSPTQRSMPIIVQKAQAVLATHTAAL